MVVKRWKEWLNMIYAQNYMIFYTDVYRFRSENDYNIYYKSEKVAAIFRAHSSMPHPYPGPGVRFNRERDKAYALESGVQKARGGAGAGGAAWG